MTSKTLKYIFSVLTVFVFIIAIFTMTTLKVNAEENEYVPPTEAEAKIYGASVNIGGDISMKYYVEIGSDIDINNITLRTEFLGVSNELNVDTDENDNPLMKNGLYYVFTLEGINPQCMGDLISAQILLDGEPIENAHSSLMDYTVEENLLKTLEVADEKIAQLINDLLAYGKASEVYTSHTSMKGDYEVRDGMVPSSSVIYDDNSDEVDLLGVNVRFGTMNYLMFKFKGENLSLESNVLIDDENPADKYIDSEGNLVVVSKPISPENFYKDVHLEYNVDNIYVQYSINDYCYDIFSSANASEEMKSLAIALYNYGLSAHKVKENHFGGTATCTEQAKCDFCGIAYGELNADNHASTEFTYTANEDGTTHKKAHKCCGVISVESEAHTFDSTTGKCVCGHEMAEAKVTSGDVDTYFETLASALGAAQSGDTVTLCSNVDLGTTSHMIPAGVTFSGGEYTVTGSGAGWFYNEGIIENGIFAFIVENRGTVNGGEFTHSFFNYGTVYGGSFVGIECERGSTLSGTVRIADSIVLFYLGECTINLSNAVFGDGAKLANGTEQELSISSLHLPDNYAVALDGTVVSVLPADKEGSFVSHSHTYEDKNNETHHWMECACGKTTEKAEHSFTYTNDSDYTHTASCDDCAYRKSEAHTLTYSASGSTITAACSANCGYIGTATVSATGKTYDGSVVEATVTKTGILENETIAITYAVKDGEALGGAPANAGTYTASITLDGQTVSVDFTIAKADPDYNVPAGLTAFLGQTLADVALPTGWAWENSTLSVGEVGENTFNAVFTPDDADNYNTVTRAVTVTVSKAAATVTTNPAAVKNLAYTGDAQALVTAGAAEGGEVQYKLGENGAYSANIPTAINAGTYTVYWKVVGDSNHSDIAEESITVSITAKIVVEEELSVTGYNASYTYTGEAIKPEITVTVYGKELVEGTDYDVTYDESPYVGEKKITITFKGNYIGEVKVSFTITSAEGTEEFDGPWVTAS